ncbi:hypothetical protein BDZ91DRAFT_128332 [Kalaharituber pfeilii]|nr:hypothetical protein BDZ91DRAFT_128332 [Kalaharituber pfeilii]
MFEMRHRVRQRRVQSGNIPPATALQQLDEVLSSLEQVRDTPNDNNQTPSPAHDPVNNSGMNRPRTAQVKNQHRQRHDQQEPHAGGPQLHQSASSRNSDNSPLKRKTAGDSAARIPTEAKRRKRAPPTRSRSHEVFFQCPHVHSNSDDLDAKCYTRFKEMYKLRKHITTSHWQHVLFKCLAPDCNKDFVTLNNLVRHVLCPKQRLTCLQSIVQRGQSISEINSKYGADLNRLQECIEQRDWNTLETRPKMKDPFGRVVQEIHTIFSQSTPEQQQCLQDLKELKFRTNMKSEAKQQLWENLFHIMGRFATSSLDRVDPIPKWNDYVERKY